MHTFKSSDNIQQVMYPCIYYNKKNKNKNVITLRTLAACHSVLLNLQAEAACRHF